MNRPRALAPGIESFAARTQTLPPATHTNCYALGFREVLIVDPAPADVGEQHALLAWVRALREAGRVPVGCLVTHHHADHVGAAAVLQRDAAIPLWAHEQTCRRMRDVTFDRVLRDGDAVVLAGATVQRWRVLHTPGHAPGHLCLHEPRASVVVLGDMIAARGTILITTEDGDMATYLAQLERLAALEARLGLPSHGDPIETPSVVLRATHAHRLMREAKVVDALRNGAATEEQMMPRVYDDTPLALWPLAVLSLRAHLDKLVREGVARCTGQGQFTLVQRPRWSSGDGP